MPLLSVISSGLSNKLRDIRDFCPAVAQGCCILNLFMIFMPALVLPRSGSFGKSPFGNVIIRETSVLRVGLALSVSGNRVSRIIALFHRNSFGAKPPALPAAGRLAADREFWNELVKARSACSRYLAFQLCIQANFGSGKCFGDRAVGFRRFCDFHKFLLIYAGHLGFGCEENRADPKACVGLT